MEPGLIGEADFHLGTYNFSPCWVSPWFGVRLLEVNETKDLKP